jgi:DNA segregation ATPase FtsK/SpoIIIE-like protein
VVRDKRKQGRKHDHAWIGKQIHVNMTEKQKKAAHLILEHNNTSASLLQRKMLIGYSEALGIILDLENFGILGPQNGTLAREINTKKIEELCGTK